MTDEFWTASRADSMLPAMNSTVQRCVIFGGSSDIGFGTARVALEFGFL